MTAVEVRVWGGGRKEWRDSARSAAENQNVFRSSDRIVLLVYIYLYEHNTEIMSSLRCLVALSWRPGSDDCALKAHVRKARDHAPLLYVIDIIFLSFVTWVGVIHFKEMHFISQTILELQFNVYH